MNMTAKSALLGLAFSGLLTNVAFANEESDAKAKAAEQAQASAEKDAAAKEADAKAKEVAKQKEAEYEKEHGGQHMPDALSITFEKPGVGSTTARDGIKFLNFGVETFASLKPGVQNFDTNYGTDGKIVGGYSDLGIKYASSVPSKSDSGLNEEEVVKKLEEENKSGETSKTPLVYAYAQPQKTIDLKLSTKDGSGIDYFGFYLPTTDQNGSVTFYRNGVQVGSLTNDQIQKGFDGEGEDRKGQGVFVNIFDKNGNFNEIRFSSTGDDKGFFTGDHTVGRFDNGVDGYTGGGEGEDHGGGDHGGGGSVGGVPEPATWTMMIIGVGLIGASLRRRRQATQALAAA